MPESEIREQTKFLARSVETYTKHRIECFICMKSESCRDVAASEFAKRLHKEGWRYSSSEIFQTIGVMCPKCFATPDDERGE